uniref:Uncharacterized protein n=1 Tax=virus sp. ctpeS3 TaxID=2826815 RepID=A0A8S5R9N4_9VIRU|nr:MAG TPA: hypothetical protein [virus sp. ctpeS3]
MNPMQMLQGMRNPQQFLQKIVGNNSVMSNPMARNAMQIDVTRHEKPAAVFTKNSGE